MKLIPQHTDTVIGQLVRLSSEINYYLSDILPNYDNMEQLEIKEHDSVHDETVAEFKDKIALLREIPITFSSMLSVYGYDVESFIKNELSQLS